MKLRWVAYVTVVAVLLASVCVLTAGYYRGVKTAADASGPTSGDITVSFTAGDKGTLSGDAEVTVEKGGAIPTAPQVRPESGYTFVGWFVTGDPNRHLVELDNLAVFGSMTLAAAYQ